MKMVKLGEKEILIINLDGKYYAIGNRCTHRGGELSKGTVEGTTINCPRHKAKFDVTTGKVISGPRIPLMHPKVEDEPSYEVKIEGTDILLKLE